MKTFMTHVLAQRYLVVFLALALLGAGLVAYNNLPLEAYPDVANMQVRIITQVPGKAAEEVERLVTIPLEKELNGIPYADPPRSVSIFGLSVITVVFGDQVNPYTARQQVLERLAQADLPEGAEPQLDPNASPVGEVYRYTVEGDSWSTMDRKEVQDWVLNRMFKSVPGIVESTSFGGPTKTYQVEIDPLRLQALGIKQRQVAEAIAASNGSTGGSYLVNNAQNYMVRGMGLLHSVQDIEGVVVSSSASGTPIRVGDIATVKIGPAIRKGQVGKNADDDVVEGIILMRRGEDPSTAIRNLMEQWDSIARSLPPGMKLEPLYDRTKLVRRTITTIGHNVAEGIVLVVVLLMLFLFQVRSSLICAVTIPLSLLTAFILLTIFKVPANLLSLGAIDFGIIVDGSVVMVENIVRRLEQLKHLNAFADPSQIQATICEAAVEVAKPILFSTAIIIMTFLPVLSFERVEGKLFRPLAITMNFNLIGAVLAGMTIIPVLCYMVFSRRLPADRESPIMRSLEQWYRPILEGALNHKILVLFTAATVFISSLCLSPLMGSEFLPELEEGNIWLRITILPTSVSLDKAVEIAHSVRHILKDNYEEEVVNVISQIGAPDDGTDPNTYSNLEVLIDLKPQEEWDKKFKTKQMLVDEMDKRLSTAHPGLQYNFSQYIKDNMDESIGGVKGEFGVKVYGSNLEELERLAKQITRIIQSVRGMRDVSHDQMIGQPQLMITIDRQRAARYGINTQDVLDIVETSIGGKTITELLDGERRFAVILRFHQTFRDSPDELGNILVPTPHGPKIPMSQIARIEPDHGATAILRDRNSRRIAIKANIRGRDMGSAVEEAQKRIAEEVKLPTGYRIQYTGQFDRAKQALGRLAIVVPITLALIFLLLYLAYGSASIAAIIMQTVPLAAAGAIISLVVTHTHFSISAGVGCIALFGVSIQNGVILVSKIRELCSSGVPTRQAVVEGAMTRMRPVLIATLVALAGLVPAALSTGIGSQSQKPFAIVIVGGILPATMLALLVLPVLYEWMETRRLKKQMEQKPPLQGLPPFAPEPTEGAQEPAKDSHLEH